MIDIIHSTDICKCTILLVCSTETSIFPVFHLLSKYNGEEKFFTRVVCSNMNHIIPLGASVLS